MLKFMVFFILFCNVKNEYLGSDGSSLMTKNTRNKYHSYDELTEYLVHISFVYPKLTKLYHIGTSELNKTLWVMELTAAPRDKIGVPNIKLIGHIHGNEPPGREVILFLLEFLTSNYENNKTVQWLLNNTKIHLLPSLNPDGYEKSHTGCNHRPNHRNNIHNVDLNSNFPNQFEKLERERQKETKAVMTWLQNVHFILSGSFHSSTLLVTYPYDGSPLNIKKDSEGIEKLTKYSVCTLIIFPAWDVASKILIDQKPQNMRELWKKAAQVLGQPSLTPDNDVFEHISSTYASMHPRMHRSVQCNNSTKSKNGIINGAQWHSKIGTMQDYNYAYHGCLEVSLFIACCQYPKPEKLSGIWKENKEAILKFISQAHFGVQGLVLNSLTNRPITHASLKIFGRNATFHSSKHGEFWRILRPGSYQLQVSAEGYYPQTTYFELKDSSTEYPKMKWLNARMTPFPLQENPHSISSNQCKYLSNNAILFTFLIINFVATI